MQKLRSNPNKLFKAAAAAALVLLAIAVSLTAYPLPAQAQALSTDATLSALTVSPKNIIGFRRRPPLLPGRRGQHGDRGHHHGHAHGLQRRRIVRLAGLQRRDRRSPGGPLGGQKHRDHHGHRREQYRDEQDYTVSVNRGVASDYGWRRRSTTWTALRRRGTRQGLFGIWTSSTTIWVVDGNDDESAYAYNHDGSRDAAKDFDFDSSHQAARGAWSDGEYVWIADRDGNKLYVYEVATGTRQNSREFDLDTENVGATGVWSDGATIWVADSFVNKVFAYSLDGGVRQHG